MNRILTGFALTIVALFLMAAAPVSAAGGPVFDIPKLDGIDIDGRADDWGDRGFHVAYLAAPDGGALPANDFDAAFRLGWNDDGLVVFADVVDDVAGENDEPTSLWRMDCVEIFVAEKVGSSNRFQVVAAPGADPTYGRLREKIYDHRPEDARGAELVSNAAALTIDDGYTVEMLLPWSNLGIEPRAGVELGFQFAANDYDGDWKTSLRVVWYPSYHAHSNSTAMYTVRLADAASRPVRMRISREIQFGGCSATVRGTGELIGTAVELRTGGNVMAQTVLEMDGGRAGARIDLPVESGAVEWPAMDVVVGGETMASEPALPTLESVIENYIDALGGRSAIEALRTRECRGQLVTVLSWHDPPRETSPLEAYAKASGSWVLIEKGETGTTREGCDGSMGWRQTLDGVEEVEGMCRARAGWLLDPHGPFHIRDYFPGMVLVSKEKQANRTVYVVEPREAGRETMRKTLRFDAATGLLVQIGPHWDIEDYRMVDGVKFPHRIVLGRKGGSSTFVFDEVSHNSAIDDTVFKKPDPLEALPGLFEGITDKNVLPMLENLPFTHGGMNVPARDGRFLYDLILSEGCTRGLEIGTSNGYSTLWLGLAFRKTGGSVITLEIDAASGREALANFEKAGLGGVIDARIADAFEEIPKIDGNFDFVFIDAWKPDYIKFWNMLKGRITPGGVLTAHNVSSQARDMRDFLEAIENDPDFETTLHQVSPAGISVSVRRR